MSVVFAPAIFFSRTAITGKTHSCNDKPSWKYGTRRLNVPKLLGTAYDSKSPRMPTSCRGKITHAGLPEPEPSRQRSFTCNQSPDGFGTVSPASWPGNKMNP